MKQKTQKFLKKSSYWLGIIIFGAILGVSLQITKAAWTEPALDPPNGNIGAPINTSSVPQVKGGSLGLTGDLAVGSKAMIGTSTIASNLTTHVGGNVGAAAYCDENGENCKTAAELGGASSIPSDFTCQFVGKNNYVVNASAWEQTTILNQLDQCGGYWDVVCMPYGFLRYEYTEGNCGG